MFAHHPPVQDTLLQPLSCLILMTPSNWGDQALLSRFSRWRNKSTERCGILLSVTQHQKKGTGTGSHLTTLYLLQNETLMLWSMGSGAQGCILGSWTRVQGRIEKGFHFCSHPNNLLHSVFRDDHGSGTNDSAGKHRVPPVWAGGWGRPRDWCRAGRDTPAATEGFDSPWPAVSLQEAIGVCSAAGFDHLPVVWFWSPGSLGGFNYLN